VLLLLYGTTKSVAIGTAALFLRERKIKNKKK
jgi:hypothetical protein